MQRFYRRWYRRVRLTSVVLRVLLGILPIINIVVPSFEYLLLITVIIAIMMATNAAFRMLIFPIARLCSNAGYRVFIMVPYNHHIWTPILTNLPFVSTGTLPASGDYSFNVCCNSQCTLIPIPTEKSSKPRHNRKAATQCWLYIQNMLLAA